MTYASLRGARGSSSLNTVCDVLADTPPPSLLRRSSTSWIFVWPGDVALSPLDKYSSGERVKRALPG
eukprot:2492128-Pleurochrysis_carterae.AAC.1